MSLLMKALEKAAKDRVEARTEPPAAEPAVVEPAAAEPAIAEEAPSAKSELTLEPLAAPGTEPAPAPPPRPAAAPRAAAAPPPSREQARAATVLQATNSAPRGPGAVAYVRNHPVMVVAVVAVLIAICFGTYVYLQVFHPGLFYKQTPIAPASPLAQAPVPAPAPAAAPAANPAPVETGAVVAAPAPQDTAAEPPPPPPPSARKPPVVEAAPPPPPAPEPALRTTIVVNRGSTAPAVSPLLTDAYAALQSNRLEDAKQGYEQLLRAEPRNVDALLGTAAVATLEGRNDEATRRYLQVLELDPRNALAQSALIGMLGRADPLAAESKLKQLIAREPSAFLYFTLGNLYADQSQWSLAQQAYFQAFHLEPGNPDYAYNLAVGLEHVSQAKLALGFYRRAIQLAGSPARARFNLAQAQERISRLASQVE
jgi:Flp pilus assembly protein TadD